MLLHINYYFAKHFILEMRKMILYQVGYYRGYETLKFHTFIIPFNAIKLVTRENQKNASVTDRHISTLNFEEAKD